MRTSHFRLHILFTLHALHVTPPHTRQFTLHTLHFTLYTPQKLLCSWHFTFHSLSQLRGFFWSFVSASGSLSYVWAFGFVGCILLCFEPANLKWPVGDPCVDHMWISSLRVSWDFLVSICQRGCWNPRNWGAAWSTKESGILPAPFFHERLNGHAFMGIQTRPRSFLFLRVCWGLFQPERLVNHQQPLITVGLSIYRNSGSWRDLRSSSIVSTLTIHHSLVFCFLGTK